MFPRVAFEYGQTMWAAWTMSSATARSTRCGAGLVRGDATLPSAVQARVELILELLAAR